MQIVNRYTNEIIFKDDSETMRQTVLNAVSKKISLSRADLSEANLSRANLVYANLSYADLSRANLSYADLVYANLSYADLSEADLSYADLSRANLSYADLSRANLSYADLSRADLSRADLSEADLSEANLENTKLPIFSKWQISYFTSNNKILVKIGCKENSIEFWDNFFSDDCFEEFETKRDSYEFKTIKNNYLSVRLFLQLEGKVKV